jgi:hypothetical protein
MLRYIAGVITEIIMLRRQKTKASELPENEQRVLISMAFYGVVFMLILILFIFVSFYK